MPGKYCFRYVAGNLKGISHMSNYALIRPWGHTVKRLAIIRFIRGLFFDGSTVKKAEPLVWSFISAHVKNGWRCVDVGANRGEFSCLMAKQAGRLGCVYAFELHPDNVKLLRSNLWRYRHRVKIENLAVSDGKTELVEVFAGCHASGAEWNIVGHNTGPHANQAEFSVKATSLDHYFQPNEKIDLIKIDVEGAAGQVLAGMTRTLRESRPLIVLEVHDDIEWVGRSYLEAADYMLCDLRGENLVRTPNFIFHCIAVPKERRAQSFLFR